MQKILAFIAAIAVAAGVGAMFAFFIVHQNERALVLEFGRPVRIIEKPGLNWKIPFMQSVEYFDNRIQDLDTQPQEVMASDQKRLMVDAFTRYKIVDPLKFYQAVRTEAQLRLTLSPIVNSAMRNVLNSVTFQDIVRDKREELMKRITKLVHDEGKEYGIEIIDVRLKRADLPPQNAKSAYDRMRAERQREAAEFRATGGAEANRIRATAEREATVIKAEATSKAEQMRGEGDAERNRIFAEAYNRDADFFGFYRSMQAYEVGMKSGDTRMLLSPDSEFFRYFTNPLATPQAPAKK